MPTSAAIYQKNGIEFVIFDKNAFNNKNIINFIKGLNNQFIYSFNKDLGLYNSDLTFDEAKEAFLKNSSIKLYNSWKKSNELMAARIPSQAMQSFMSMQTVGYTEDPGNNVYVSHWQLYLQGSDYDIDKAYVMTFGFSKGVYEG